MALPAGSFVGPFEVVGLLGAGGMGEVYRAKDRRLKRDVAVKILPAEMNKNPEWARRFESEARAASAINHPNILAVYDLGTHEGAPFVVCELLEGETLSAKLKDGPIPPRKAFDYARQIAEGLAAAHDKGIVHRDLKPENLFITGDGRIKILDFGLAKLNADVTTERPPGQENTLLQQTQPGVVMGTAGYMSPEQVRGQNVDHRSDIFSMGAVLYEMFTGKRAFHGDSSVETMSAVLQTEPPTPSSILPTLVAGLDQVIAHCLEKNPAQRFQTARDVAFALHALTTMTGAAPALSAPAHNARRWPRIAVVGCLVAGAAAIGFFSGRRVPHTIAEAAVVPAPALTVSPPSYRRLTYRHGNIANARFGPDGKSVYLDAVWGEDHTQWAIHFVTPDSPETRLIDLKSETQLLGLSPKGEMAVLRNPGSSGGTLARLPIGSNAPRDVQEHVFWADWLPDGDSLVVAREGGATRRIELPGGRVIAETSGFYSHLRVQPAGNRISFIEHPALRDDRGQMVVVDLEGKQVLRSRMFGSMWGAAWAPNGELWFTASVSNEGRALRALSVDGTDRVLAVAPSFMTLEDIAPDGRALILKHDELWRAYAMTGNDKRERDLSWFDRSLVSGISADGRTVLLVEGAEAGGAAYRTYLRRTDGSDAVFLGSGQGVSLSRDGNFVVMTNVQRPGWAQVVPTGTGDPTDFPGTFEQRLPAWMPNGQEVWYVGREPGQPQHLYLQKPGEAPRKMTAVDEVLKHGSVFPKDEKTFATVNRDSKQLQLVALADGTVKPTKVTLDDKETLGPFTPDGANVLVMSLDEIPAHVSRANLDTGKRTAVREMMPTDASTPTMQPRFHITPDASAYAHNSVKFVNDLYVVEGVR